MKTWIIISLVLIALTFVWGYDSIKSTPVRPKIFVIGLDGASWNLMEPLLKQGKLPNIQKLIRGGTAASLSTLIPTWSPLLWTSIATGKLPAKHGIQASLSDSGKLVIAEGNQRKAKAFWNILSDRNYKVGIVNWWVTWPAEKVNGFVVSDRYRRSRTEPGLTYPPDLLQSLPRVGVTPNEFEYDKRLFRLPSSLESIVTIEGEESINYKIYWGQDKAVKEACRQLLKNDVDLFAAVFRIVDVSSHFFWKFLQGDKRSDQDYAAILEPIYVYADRIVGDFLEHADSNTQIVICSDHGFEAVGKKFDHSKTHAPPAGILILHGSEFRKNFRMKQASILDITPTVLHLLGVPVGRDMDGRVLSEALNLSQKPVYISSHDSALPEQAPAQQMDEETKEDFRALGYIQ